MEEIELTLYELFNLIIDRLHLSKLEMLKQYDKNIRFHNYMDGEKIWLKIKRDGPWIVLRKMPNGVNFEINNEKISETKVVHDDRLSPIRNKREKSNPSNSHYNDSNDNSANVELKIL